MNKDFVICDNQKDIDDNCSCYGNDFYTIAKEDILALLAGKTICAMCNDEYGVFIKMEDE